MPFSSIEDPSDPFNSSLISLLLNALGQASVGATLQRADLSYRAIFNLPDYVPQVANEQASDERLFGGAVADTLRAPKQAVLESGEKQTVTLTITIDLDEHVWACTIQRRAVGKGGYELLTTIVDLTEQRLEKETRTALLREVSHRSRNLLAIVQSIAMHTARSTDTIDKFLAKFRGRIASLATSQDIVTSSNWRGAFLFDLANRQFENSVPQRETNISISVTGDNVHLKPNTAMNIGLALHELAVNSVLFGSLSGRGGNIVLDNRLSSKGGIHLCTLQWDERIHAPAAEPPGKITKNFGSTVLERVVPVSVGGKSRYSVSDDHVQYQLEFNPF